MSSGNAFFEKYNDEYTIKQQTKWRNIEKTLELNQMQI